MRLETQRSRRRLFDMTPLIDVVFNLLLFFMLASNFEQWRTIAVAAPAVGGARATVTEDVLRVRVIGGGAVTLDGRPLTLEALGEQVRGRLSGDPGRLILVQSDPNATVQDLVAVLDRLTAAGGSRLSLAP